ncbi:homeobox-DDT domain protein RLT2-like isoform X2 [Actinidia eriantha]|uniref:homeobox-DDT domain protein RLT2-like isoform X2 n=1 Tax=Actinidia eriantha TaxID=165200 RepID=UPI002588236B|nr:homeobox-DDT domain protein RLT2-like isoform X2 [Actinidia eriantha]
MEEGGSGGGGGCSEVEKKKKPEGENKVKRKMKTASQLEILEKTYAVEAYPSEALRAELSVQLGLSDRQLQMWFCHRRLKDRKTPPVKRQKKDFTVAPASSSGVGDEMVVGEVGNEHASGSGSGSSPFGHVESQQQRVAPRTGAAIARIATDMPTVKRYYEPPQAISELRAIAFVEAQLGEPLREDGPILGMEFDPLPPGAFGAPIMSVGQQKPATRHYESNLYERTDAKPIKGAVRALHEYQFLPEQPSVRNDSFERAAPSHCYGSPTDVPSARSALSTGRSYMHGNEQVPPAFGFQGQTPSLGLLPHQGRQSHLLPSTSAEYDIVSRKTSIANIGTDAHFGTHPITALDNPFIPSERQVTNDEDIARLERKRKSEEARIAREVEAHEKRIRKELEKQDILRRKREEQMRKEMERQDRERRKEEERLLREKQREEVRYQREQRREMERREKFLQKESIRAEKLRLKEELRREKDAARQKAASDRATARRIAKESMELIEDERLELMELAASSKCLPSILSLDGETLQNLELFKDKLIVFPPKSVNLKRPFAIKPWCDSEENTGNLFMVWRFLITFADVLGLWPFTLDEFVQAFHDYDPRLLGEIHIALLRSIIKDIEDVARTPSTGLGTNQNCSANPGGGHPQIVQGAYAWGFDIRSWQRHLNPLTWPEILRQFALAAGYGPKLKKRSIEQAYIRDENEGDGGEDVISILRNGAAAENAVAIMQERGFSNPRRSRHRVTPGTVKFAAFHVLSLEGSNGLTILEVADRIQKSGLRDLTTSKTPEASIAAALSRDTKLFERTAPSTYCVRSPYRKDPADAEAILSTAREKIQIFKTGYLDGEDAEDVEHDDVERDEDSESDVAEDPETDDLGTEMKPNNEALSCEANRFLTKTYPGDGKEASRDEVMRTSQVGLKNLAGSSPLMQSEGYKDVKRTSASVDQSVDVARFSNEAANLDQEDTVIDESNSGEPWVQGLVEGEYSDLSVEERLNALVALIGVANEGNSIRVILEDRLEAANALKKQMWAEVQLDKRRMKEDYVMKMQYSSFISYKFEPNIQFSSVEGRQSPLPAVDDKNVLASTNPVIQQEHIQDSQNDTNYCTPIPTERNQSIQDFSAGTDNHPLLQTGFAAERSRSQLKAYIGHKAEEMYVYRSLPLGQDRRRNRYWQFITSASRNDPGSGRIFVELRDGCWRLIDSEEDFDALLESLDVRGSKESNLHSMLQKVEVYFKETLRKNLVHTKTELLTVDNVKNEVAEMASKPDCSGSTNSPTSTCCVSNSDLPEPSSSFAIDLGRNEAEKRDALKRYQDLEKWMWEECLNSSVLCAIKFGKKRCKQLLDICDYCLDLYLSEDNYCPSCHRTSEASIIDNNFSEHVAQWRKKFEGDGWTFQGLYSSSLLRIRLLKPLLALIEVSIPAEAIQPDWSEAYRKSWGMKLHTASSAEDLLQILTLLEGAVKKDFLSSNFETTKELLGSCNRTESAANISLNPEIIAVLPWVPQTSSAVTLRLMELDASISYMLHQKIDSYKDKGAGDFFALPSKFALVKSIPEDDLIETPHEGENLLQEPWIDHGSVHSSSGRGRGARGRGRGRTRGGRSQRRSISSRSVAAPRSTTTNNERFGQLLGWKGRSRGRGGRKRSRRTARSRQKPGKRVADIGSERDQQKEIFFDNTVRSLDPQWNREETMEIQVEAAENASSSERSEYDDYNGLAAGDEYDDLLPNDYSSVFNGKSDHLIPGVDYNVDGEEDDDDRVEGDDDVDDEEEDDSDQDEHGDTDVERYINDDSDDEGNQDGGEPIGNPDEATGSTSSDFSD